MSRHVFIGLDYHRIGLFRDLPVSSVHTQCCMLILVLLFQMKPNLSVLNVQNAYRAASRYAQPHLANDMMSTNHPNP